MSNKFTIINKPLIIGGHLNSWNGVANSGEQVAFGVYVVRLKVDGQVSYVSISLVK